MCDLDRFFQNPVTYSPDHRNDYSTTDFDTEVFTTEALVPFDYLYRAA